MWEAFGPGVVFGIPVGGNVPTNKTPQNLIGIQEVSFNRTAKNVPLWGSNQFPDAYAVSDKEVKGKVKLARTDADMWNNLIFGNPTNSTNAPIVFPNESHTIPASPGPYTVTVTNHTTFSQDLQPRYANGQPFTNMQGGSLTEVGQYNVSAGVYTFYSGDAGVTVLISYETTSTAGTNVTEFQQIQGWSPIVRLICWEYYNSTINQSNNNGYIFWNCIFGGLNVPIKRDDWEYPEVEFAAFPDPNTVINGTSNPVWSILDGAGIGL
jgi:hypothetical protein